MQNKLRLILWRVCTKESHAGIWTEYCNRILFNLKFKVKP